MIRAASIPRGRRVSIEMPWWQIGLYALANLPLIIVGIGGMEIDWATFADALAAYFRGDLYAPSDVRFVWSPIAALLLAVFVPFGYIGWAVLHVLTVGLLASPTLILLVALSGGFWADLAFGNTVTFVFTGAAGGSHGRPYPSRLWPGAGDKRRALDRRAHKVEQELLWTDGGQTRRGRGEVSRDGG